MNSKLTTLAVALAIFGAGATSAMAGKSTVSNTTGPVALTASQLAFVQTLYGDSTVVSGSLDGDTITVVLNEITYTWTSAFVARIIESYS